MFNPPSAPKVLAYFGNTSDVKKLHKGEDFSARLEDEIRIHQGQIQAENLLLNSVAKYQHIASKHHIPRDDFNQLLRDNKYNLDTTKNAMIQRYDIAETEFSQPIDFEPIDTADYMRQRASMIGAVLSSTPVLLRDPWDGKPATTQYGFSDFKSEVDGVGFSAIATPRYKGIPFRFAVMKHEHDGFVDNNPAMILSNEFCDAFEQYNKDKGGNVPADQHPLIAAMATNLKPNIHDRFHNWLLYDINAASDVFKQWGNDIYFVEHADKNPLLINYEQVALCFHLYAWQTLFDKNPGLKDQVYDRLEECMGEIKKFGDYLKETRHPKAEAIEESTTYAVLSNICFVLNPYEERFQRILAAYPDVKQKLLEVRHDGKGIGATLERLHGYEHGIPSQKYGGAKEAAIEYILRYPLAEEIRTKLKAERSHGKPDDWQEVDGKRIYTMNLKSYNELPPDLKSQIRHVPDSNVLPKLSDALQKLPEGLREEASRRIHVSEEGYFFFRLGREELDYTQFEKHSQQKKVLLVDIPNGQEVHFSNEKKLSIKDRVKKQDFHLVGGKDVLAINVRDEAAANAILDYARTENGIDPNRAIEKARELAAMTGEKSAGDMYKIERNVAENLYHFQQTGFYQAKLEKYLARAAGPIVMQLHSGGDQRLVKGAFVYLPLGKDPVKDNNPDCHLMENTDFKRDYDSAQGTDLLNPVQLKPDSTLMQYPHAQQALDEFLQTLHEINFQITHGAGQAAKLSKGGKGLFS
jgi:hypothetical protein